jgi:hypothetical protein
MTWQQYGEEFPELKFCQEFNPAMLSDQGFKAHQGIPGRKLVEVSYDAEYVREKLQFEYFQRIQTIEDLLVFGRIFDELGGESYARLE